MTNSLHCVLDASVCIKHFIPDPFSHKVDTLLTHLAHPQTDIYVPDLFYIEMANILWKYFRAGQITDSKIRNDLATLKAFDLRITSTAELMEEAISIAILYDISAYDASYVALSQRVQAPLLTLDNKLLKALVASSFNIVSFADFTLPPI